jgi:hypothetical protein
MRVVALLAVAGLIALIVAVSTGSAWAAGVVIALASAGIVLLLRDWRGDRTGGGIHSGSASSGTSPVEAPDASLTPDDFSPDLSADPQGPSSDARAD